MSRFVLGLIAPGLAVKRTSVIPPPASQEPQPPAALLPRFEHTVLVLQLSQKAVSLSRKGVLQGLSDESAAEMRQLGSEGWELVSVLPFTTGGVGMFSSAAPRTDAALAFFKRTIST